MRALNDRTWNKKITYLLHRVSVLCLGMVLRAVNQLSLLVSGKKLILVHFHNAADYTRHILQTVLPFPERFSSNNSIQLSNVIY